MKIRHDSGRVLFSTIFHRNIFSFFTFGHSELMENPARLRQGPVFRLFSGMTQAGSCFSMIFLTFRQDGKLGRNGCKSISWAMHALLLLLSFWRQLLILLVVSCMYLVPTTHTHNPQPTPTRHLTPTQQIT